MSDTYESTSDGRISHVKKRIVFASSFLVILLIGVLVAFSASAKVSENPKISAAAECPWNLARSIKVVVLFDRSSFVGQQRYGGSTENISAIKNAIAGPTESFIDKLAAGETVEIQRKHIVLLPFAQKPSPTASKRVSTFLNSQTNINSAKEIVNGTVFKTSDAETYTDPFDPSSTTNGTTEGTSNWEAALKSTDVTAANGSTHVVMITGSNPTISGVDATADFTTDESDIAKAESAANEIVDRKSKLYIVGAGNKVSQSVIDRVASRGKGYYGSSYNSIKDNLDLVINDIFANNCETEVTTPTTTPPGSEEVSPSISLSYSPASGTRFTPGETIPLSLRITNTTSNAPLGNIELYLVPIDGTCDDTPIITYISSASNTTLNPGQTHDQSAPSSIPTSYTSPEWKRKACVKGTAVLSDTQRLAPGSSEVARASVDISYPIGELVFPT